MNALSACGMNTQSLLALMMRHEHGAACSMNTFTSSDRLTLLTCRMNTFRSNDQMALLARSMNTFRSNDQLALLARSMNTRQDVDVWSHWVLH